MATHKAAGGSISRKTNPTTLNRPKRRTPEASGDRDSSPDKRHVSFDRRLERGPTPSSPHRRPNQSPSRSALSNRAAKQSALAEQQLLAEMQSPTGGSPSNHHWQDSHGLHHGDCPEFPGQLEGALPRWQPETAGYIQPGSSDSYNSWTLLQIKDEEARDREVCRRVHDLRALIVEFAREYACETSRRYTRPQNIARDLCRNARNAQLIRYIGCLAYGGPNGVQDWDNILAGSETMAALVTGIISTALREHVFAALWFGGTTDEIEELEKLEDKQKDDDGETLLTYRLIILSSDVDCSRLSSNRNPCQKMHQLQRKSGLSLASLRGCQTEGQDCFIENAEASVFSEARVST